MQYRKRPVSIEAFQFTLLFSNGKPENDPPQWFKEAVIAGKVNVYLGQTQPRVNIHTREGVMTANPGDWIIQGVEGELYPCKDSIFQKTYVLDAPDSERPTKTYPVKASGNGEPYFDLQPGDTVIATDSFDPEGADVRMTMVGVVFHEANHHKDECGPIVRWVNGGMCNVYAGIAVPLDMMVQHWNDTHEDDGFTLKGQQPQVIAQPEAFDDTPIAVDTDPPNRY